ncbi:glycosyltransferase family 39 protein [Fodinicurvata sp. EGI_FJ10296]|uniref:ArnT family glycosyltransferase n=1 Tax=Fodinicurvata sp. EGI_FJ10296 TaxID=3231908 RepID=UPI003456334A
MNAHARPGPDTTVTQLSRTISPTAAMAAILAIGTIMRIVNAASIGLGVDESYVTTVSRTLSLSYFDHPPLHYWIIHATAWLTGTEHPVVIRLPFIAIFALTTWLMYRLTAKLCDPWSGVAAALLLNLSAVFSLTTGGWALPDGPLMAALLAAALVLANILLPRELRVDARHERHKMLGAWSLAGLFGGLAMLSKYHGVFLFVGVLVFLLSHRGSRHWLTSPGPWIGALIAAAVASPVLIWNIQHDFVSIAFQGGRGAPGDELRPDRILSNIAGQAAWILPWIFVPLAWVFVRAALAGPGDPRRWFLVCLGAGPILVFTIVVMWGSRGLFHWQAPGWLMIFPLLGAAVAGRLRSGNAVTRWWLTASAVLLAAITIILATHTATGWIRAAVPTFEGSDPTVEALTWRELRVALESSDLLDGGDRFVVALHWLEGGKIGQALGPDMPIVCFCSDPRHFAFMADPSTFEGRDAVIIGRRDTIDRHGEAAADRFAGTGPRHDITIDRGGRAEVPVSFIPVRDLLEPYRLPYPDRFDRDSHGR